MILRGIKAVVVTTLLYGTLLVSCSTPGEELVPVVAEGLYINEVYASGDDWIELYNSLETSKDISGYLIYDNVAAKYKIPAATTIPAKGFLILICNDLGSGLNTNFKLTSTGETVFLENALGTLIDRVEFPELNAGQSYGRYPDGSTALAVSGTTTQGATNGNSQAPAIASVTRQPLVPALNQAVTITTTVITNSGIASVKLFHRFNGGTYTSLDMTLTGTSYTAIIPGVSTTGLVRAWHLFHVNWVYFTGLTGGSFAFVAVQKVTKAKWSGVIIRFAEAAPFFFWPVSAVGFLLIFTVGYPHIFPDMHGLGHGKEIGSPTDSCSAGSRWGCRCSTTSASS